VPCEAVAANSYISFGNLKCRKVGTKLEGLALRACRY
jgi:hypothetical protein